jgi:hypothetical protein
MPETTLTIPQGNGNVAVALDGDLAVLGFGGDAKHGQLAVFRRDKGTWGPDGTLTVGWPGHASESGAVLAVSDDLIAVGAPSCTPSDDSHPGVVYLFERRDAGWTRVVTLRAPEPAKGDCFGHAVALQYGRLAVASTLATYVYDCEAGACAPVGEWSEPATSLALDGERLAVGSRGSWRGDLGRVRIYEDGGAEWRTVATFEASDPVDNLFGSAVAFGPNTLVIGAPAMGEATRLAPGAVYVFEDRPQGWTQRARLVADTGSLGDSVAIADDRIVAATNSSETFVFQRWFGAWKQEDRWGDPLATTVPHPIDRVAMSGDTILAGHLTTVPDQPWNVEGQVYRCVAPPVF